MTVSWLNGMESRNNNENGRLISGEGQREKKEEKAESLQNGQLTSEWLKPVPSL